MPTLQLIKGFSNTLKPANPEAEEYLSKIGFNDQLTCKITRPRNLMFHKKFFALLGLVFENQELYANRESFRKEIIMRAGFFEKHVHLTGKVSYVAKSMAFDSMDEGQFTELYDKTCAVILKYFWKDMSKAQLEEAVMDFMTDYAA